MGYFPPSSYPGGHGAAQTQEEEEGIAWPGPHHLICETSPQAWLIDEEQPCSFEEAERQGQD